MPGDILKRQRGDLAVRRHRDPPVDHVVARMDVGQEAFQPVRHELHRAPQRVFAAAAVAISSP